MRDFVAKPIGIVFVAVVVSMLTISNIVLATSVLKLRRANMPSSSGLAEGVTVPVITGRKIKVGEMTRVLPVGTSAMFLLVYRESCHYCEQNWPNWEKIFSGPHSKIPAILVTSDKVVDLAYESAHPLLDRRLALDTVDPGFSCGACQCGISGQFACSTSITQPLGN